jgi:phospholipase C
LNHPCANANVGLTRRTLLRAAGGALVASGALPAWARPVAGAAAIRGPDSLPFPHLPAGTSMMPKIEHIVVLIMENHSFDNILGMVPHVFPERASVDGLTLRHGRIQNFNPGTNGDRVFANRPSSPCQEKTEPGQDWNASHESYDGGRNDGFVRLGLIATDSTTFKTPAANGTIFDRLDAHGINWGVYYQNLPSWLIVPGVIGANARRAARQHKFDAFFTDVAAGKLPQFTFLDPNYTTTSEENPQDIQVGEEFIARVVNALIHAPTWKSTALFITYDEHGGYYDHVPRRGQSAPTRSRRCSARVISPAPMTVTASACH